jgi:hypothetical protein
MKKARSLVVLQKFRSIRAANKWLELLMEDCEVNSERARFLHKETDELISIFTTIVSKVRKNQE